MPKIFSRTLFIIIISGLIISCSSVKSVYHDGGLISSGNDITVLNEGEEDLQFAPSFDITSAADNETLKPLKEIKKLKRKSEILENNSFLVGEQTFVYFVADTIPPDTVKDEPKLQPMITLGGGVFVAGMAVTALGVFSGGPIIFIGIGAMIAGLLLTNFGYKKVKDDPEKWKGEKLALTVYYLLIPVGLFLMLYPLYLLFII